MKISFFIFRKLYYRNPQYTCFGLISFKCLISLHKCIKFYVNYDVAISDFYFTAVKPVKPVWSEH